MKKILTIAATALLSTFAVAAHAADPVVNFPGSVAGFCSLEVLDGTLDAATTAVSVLNTVTPATAKVVCNSGSTLAVAVGTGSVAHGATVATTFTTGGTGVYAGLTTANITTTTAQTLKAGAVAKIAATITAPETQLLPKGDNYNAVVDVKLTAE